MKMIEYLEQDKDRILTGLRSASSPADAQQLLEKETARLLLQYNEDCASVRVRDAASGMMQALRSSVPFLDTMGEPRVWREQGTTGVSGQGAGSGQGRGHRLSLVLLIAGAVLSLAAFAVPALSAGGTAVLGTLLKGLLLPVAGGSCLYLAGRTAGSQTRIGAGRRSGAAGGAEARVEITVDPEKLWSSLRGAVMVVDRNLEAAREGEAYENRKNLAAVGGQGLSAEEVELFSSLLETADADSPQMAADLRYYLHKKNVDVIEWSSQTAVWFEMLPALPGAAGTAGKGPAAGGGHTDRAGGGSGTPGEAVTIRPALAQGGKLLKKGIAVR